MVGESGSREIVVHLWTKGITSTAAQDNEVESLVVQLVSAVSQIEGEDESGAMKERKVKEKVSNYLSKAKIVSGPAWEKMNGVGWSSLELRFRRAQVASGQLMECSIVLGLWWKKEMVKFFLFPSFSFFFVC